MSNRRSQRSSPNSKRLAPAFFISPPSFNALPMSAKLKHIRRHHPEIVDLLVGILDRAYERLWQERYFDRSPSR
jgi:hypothetical protein